jgi:hypothetical protein
MKNVRVEVVKNSNIAAVRTLSLIQNIQFLAIPQ